MSIHPTQGSQKCITLDIKALIYAFGAFCQMLVAPLDIAQSGQGESNS